MIAQIYNILTQLPESAPIAALFLGLLTALNPCQLSISMSALTFLVPRGATQKTAMLHVLAYALGRSVLYIVLGWLLKSIFVLTRSDALGRFWQSAVMTKWVDELLPYVMVGLAVFFLWRSMTPRHKHESCHNSGPIIRREGHLGAFALGFVLAMAFCPESAVFYFGGMLPLSLTSVLGWGVPILFAVAAAVPVVLFGWLMVMAKERMQRFSSVVGSVQRAVNALCGVLCLALAIWVWMTD